MPCGRKFKQYIFIFIFFFNIEEVILGHLYCDFSTENMFLSRALTI